MSFFEVALEWKGDMWATKLILESDLKEADSLEQGLAVDLPKPIQQQQQEPEKEQSNLDAKKEINELRKTAGTWKLAPKMVSQKNISTLDMLLLVCRATWKCHAERARIIVSPPQVLQHNLACSQAAFWAFELEEMVASALWKKQELRMMHPMDQDNQQLLLEHAVFFHHLLSCRATSLAAAHTMPPVRWNGVLLGSPAEAALARDTLLQEWELLLRLEAASLHTKGKSHAWKKCIGDLAHM